MQSTDPPPRLRRGQVLDLVIEGLIYGGAGISHLRDDQSSDDGMVVMTKGGLPGDRVRARVRQIKRKRHRHNMSNADIAVGGRSYAEATLLSKIEESPTSIKPKCQHHEACGGCKTQSMEYGAQIEQKQEQIEFLFRKLQGQAKILPIIKAERLYAFRNKMEFTFGSSLWHEVTPLETAGSDQHFGLGLHADGRYDKVVSIENCLIQESVGNQILGLVRERCLGTPASMEPYNPRTHEGFLRHLTIRSSYNANGALEVMVNLVTSPCDAKDRLAHIAEELISSVPSVVCVLQSMTDSKANISSSKDGQRLLAGTRPYIEQNLGGLNFRISADSFFQTNAHQATALYEQVMKRSNIRSTDTVLDLFCGTGTIGLYLSRYCKAIVGIEVVQAAVHDAKINAERNGIENASFFQGDLEKIKHHELPSACDKVDIIIIDPPRCGLHKELVKHLSRSSARTIVYVSCNPATQVRDILALQERAPGQFAVRQIQPVDMFPHTPHIECVVAIDRISRPLSAY